jgi:hypothetical protein
MSSLTRRGSLLAATLGASLMVCTSSALALNPQPLPPRHDPLVLVASEINPQPLPPFRHEPSVLGHTLLNPQPLPPRR